MNSNTTIEEILQEAEQFPWWRLTHCRGFATDVPQILRDLASPNEEVKEDAVNEGLFDRLSHQYTVYPASFFSLPFIVGILRNQGINTHHGVVSYLEIVLQREKSCFHTLTSLLSLGLKRPNTHATLLPVRNRLVEFSSFSERNTAESARHLVGFCDDPKYFTKRANQPDPRVGSKIPIAIFL